MKNLKRLLQTHPAPWRTGTATDPHWCRDVRDGRGDGVEWCGGVHGAEVAAAIVEAVNAAAVPLSIDAAIMICAVAASTPGFLIDFGYGHIDGASRIAWEIADAAHREAGEDGWAGAEALLQTGWRP